MKTIEEIWSIVNGLKELYPDGVCSLDYRKDYELLFSVRLAAQCTDERVNKVTPALYARFPTLEALAEAGILDSPETWAGVRKWSPAGRIASWASWAPLDLEA